ncbi:MAG: lysophospholipase [Rhodobacteraceae bacterium]|nr:lysophospholipase [Paracoccaceae bacterium]
MAGAPQATPTRFDAARIGPDPEAYLAAGEARFAGLRPGTAKQIVWAGQAGNKTPLSLVYVHGWSASLEELRPVPDLVARALGANLFLTRLSGHGLDGAALAAAGPDDWLADSGEALAVGQCLGDRVILFGTSTGAALVAYLAAHAVADIPLAGAVLVSPNFRIAGRFGDLLTCPALSLIAPLLAKRIEHYPGHNDRHDYFWTRSYPSSAVLPLARLVQLVRQCDFAATGVPALFIYNMKDNVVRHDETERVIAAWGGPVSVMQPDIPEDQMHGVHVLAGDILSPSRTAPVAERIIAWAREL